MRVNLRTHPKTIRLAAKLGVSKNEAVGCLHAAWVLADQHADEEGRLDIPSGEVDALIEQSGFCVALAAVGWLLIGDDWIQFVDYREHNGATAKARAENTRRQRVSRKKRDTPSRDVRDKSATREEKRREETPPTPSSPDPPQSDPPAPPPATEDWGGVEELLVSEDVCLPTPTIAACKANGLSSDEVKQSVKRWREKSSNLGPGALVSFLKGLRPGEDLVKLLAGGAAAKAEQRRRREAQADARRDREAAELTSLERDAGAALDALSPGAREELARVAIDTGDGGGLWYVWCKQCRGRPPREWPASVRLACLRALAPEGRVRR